MFSRCAWVSHFAAKMNRGLLFLAVILLVAHGACHSVVSLAGLSRVAGGGSGLLPCEGPCPAPQGFLGVLVGSGNVCGRDVQVR